MDPLEGIVLEGTRVLLAGTDHPDHAVLKGDRLIVRETEAAAVGALIVTAVGDSYTLFTHDGVVPVYAVVVGVVRAVGDA